MTRLIFCSDPFDAHRPDTDYSEEVTAVRGLRADYSLISYEALVNDGDSEKAVRRVVEAGSPEIAVYRGWMVTPEQYTQLYDALRSRNLTLINSPEEYRHCHYLPESYLAIEAFTPKSIWLPASSGLTMENIATALEPFGASPVIVKDYVKSQKHAWDEACFIPSARDRKSVERVVSRFLELQGEDLQGGLVFREYLELEPLTVHSKSGMPLTKEFRIFFYDGEPIYWTRYWEEGEYGSLEPPIEQFRGMAQQVQSHFFTMDIAKIKDGKWIIVELGDGQVAGLPHNTDVNIFYTALLAS